MGKEDNRHRIDGQESNEDKKNKMKKIILTEEQFNKNKKHLIREYLEVLRGDTANSALRVINNLYQRIVLQIEQGKPYIEESTTILNTRIDVMVGDRLFEYNSEPRYHGRYVYDIFGFDNHIEAKFNTKAALDYNTFKSVILHELTHHLDDDKHNKINANINVELLTKELKNSEDDNKKVVGLILYKLWSPTERNAFTTTIIQGKEALDEYVDDLKTNIYMLKVMDWNERPYINMWYMIGRMMKLPRNTTQNRIINLFYKKSIYLLKKFYKKAIQRMRQHAMDPENQYDTSAKLTMELLQTKQQIKKLARDYRDENVDLQQFIQILKDKKLITNYNQEELTQLATQQFNEQQEIKTRVLAAFEYTGNDSEEFAQLAIEQGVKLDKQTIIDIYTNFPNRR